MKKLLTCVFIPLCILIFNACDDEETYREVSVLIPQEYLTNSLSPHQPRRWIFISDEKGNPIDNALIKGAGTVVLRIPQNTPDETVTLNFYSIWFNGLSVSRDLISFGGISPGSYSISLPPSSPASMGTAQITLENLPNEAEVTVTGSAGEFEYGNNVIHTDILGGNQPTPNMLLSAFDEAGGEGRYTFLNVAPGNSLTVDYTTLNPYEKIEIPAIKDSAFVAQTGYKNDVGYRFRKSGLQFYTTGITAYHSDVFDSYFTSIDVYDHYDVHRNVSFGSTPPTSFNILQVTAEVVVDSGPSFTLNLTGNADVVETSFWYAEENDWGWWGYQETKTYYTPFTNVVWFHYPKLPQEIIDEHGEERGGHHLEEVTIIDYENFSSYGDFINYRLNENNFSGEIKSNARSKRIKL